MLVSLKFEQCKLLNVKLFLKLRVESKNTHKYFSKYFTQK